MDTLVATKPLYDLFDHYRATATLMLRNRTLGELTMRTTTHARGSALVSVILVLLVLTIVGVGIAYFTSMEDRLSGNTRIAKAAFYAADAGLRRAELALSNTAGPEEHVPADPRSRRS